MVKDNYNKKYSALILVFFFGLIILYMLRNFLTPIITAVILSFLVYPVYSYFLKKTKGKEILSASLVIVFVLLVVFIPLSIGASVALNQINNLDLDPEGYSKYEQTIFDLTGTEISISEGVNNLGTLFKSEAKTTLPKFVSLTSNFLISVFVMFFVMFYLILDKDKVIKLVCDILPFSKKNSQHLILESGKVTRAVLIGQVLTAIIQGFLGMISFIIAGVSGAFFWGFIMMILSVIPVIGAFLIWVPAGIFLLIEGQIWQGVFVLVWGVVVVSNVDNIVRPKLVGKFADIHPLEVFLGVIIGLSTFGMIGIVLGPLIVSLFKTLIKVYHQEYFVA
ncbi:MAG: AI-2E family transporter [Candidatus Woesearchaeota archaeon]|jgi:predicted PurR-regulated permease PerM|nr:AI-2E family transporter [Candidatus Woesearchaeota archaeon]